MLIGIVGKPSSGKTTFLNALCKTDAKTADYPFTTIQPNTGIGFAYHPCVCIEVNVTCQPRNSECIDKVRKIPIKIIDVAGLVPGAHEGRGLGNQFLSDLSEADVLLHIVDCSGSLNEEGENVDPGSHDPLKDVQFLEDEIVYWMFGIIGKKWDRMVKRALSDRVDLSVLLAEQFSGLKITRSHILQALKKTEGDPTKWKEADLLPFIRELRAVAKPILVIANKIDRPTSTENFKKLQDYLGAENVVPASALIESILKNYHEKGAVQYNSYTGELDITDPSLLSSKEQEIVQRIKNEILSRYGTSGIISTINKAVFEILNMISVYPVADTTHFADGDGTVLPDVFLVPKGTTCKELAGKVHREIAEKFIHGIDAKTNRRIADNYELKDKDIIKIVHAG
ncbi:MAG: redox-regulated ATPase YchF [Promethearchaeota archaeon]